jgi:hypothetical protein
MNMEVSVSSSLGPVPGALLSGFTNVAEDGTLCFVSDRVYRVCPACGTVFTGSAWRTVMTGHERCPYCGGGGTTPLVRVWEA